MTNSDASLRISRSTQEAIQQLPWDWHGAGTVANAVLDALVRHAGQRPIRHSMETGSGRTTLLFSHLSEHHQVFAVDAGGSISRVRSSPLLNPGTVEFVEGPTQQTLPAHRFEHPLQLAMIDGPHGYPFPDLEYYYIYPHLETGALLIVDDIQIPTIRNLAQFLKADDMFELVEVVEQTAFFRRTAADVFHPLCDGWWLQKYNTSPPEAAEPEPELAALRAQRDALQAELNRIQSGAFWKMREGWNRLGRVLGLFR